MSTLVQLLTGTCSVSAEIVANWQVHVFYVLSQGQQIKKENKQ